MVCTVLLFSGVNGSQSGIKEDGFAGFAMFKTGETCLDAWACELSFLRPRRNLRFF